MAHQFNMTELGNLSSASGMLEYANTASEGFLVGGFVMAVYVILLMLMSRHNDVAQSFAVSSFVMFVMSTLFRYMGVLNMMFVWLFLILTAISTLYIYTRRN